MNLTPEERERRREQGRKLAASRTGKRSQPRPRLKSRTAVLEALAERVALGNESATAAARALGLSPVSALRVMLTPEYAAARATVLARTRQGREQSFQEIANVVTDTALHGALRQNEIVKRRSTDPRLVHAVADSALDRIGARVATKVDNTVRVELGPDTIALLAKADREFDQVRAVALEDGPFAYALRRPDGGVAAGARALVGTATPTQAPDADASSDQT